MDCSHGQSTCLRQWTQQVWAQMSSTTCLLTTTWTPGGWRSQQRSTQPSRRRQSCQQPWEATRCVLVGTNSSWVQHRPQQFATCSTTPQSCTLRATTGNKPNCLHCAPTASNRRDASEMAQSTSSTEGTTWEHKWKLRLAIFSTWQRMSFQPSNCGTLRPTPLEAAFSRRLPMQQVGYKVLFGTTTHLCPFNRWLDLNMDGTRPSSTAWSTPECKHSTGCQQRFNSIWTRSWRTNVLSNKAFNFHTGEPRHQSVLVATQRSWNLSMPTPTWLSTSLISASTMEQQEKMPTWMKRRRIDPTWDQQVGDTATSLAQQPKTTEMMMSTTGSPTPKSTDK